MVYQNISSRWLLTGYATGTMCSPDSIITTRISPHPQNKSWQFLVGGDWNHGILMGYHGVFNGI